MGNRPGLLAAALVMLPAAGVVAAGAGSDRAPGSARPHGQAVEVRVGPRAAGVSRLRLGVTHGQYSADPFGDRRAVRRARRLLRRSGSIQNQHLMGFGALNPEPRPGRFAWRSLDARLRLMRTTGGEPTLTLCCAPDWMKGGRPGRTDWSRLEEAPAPAHVRDFARLAAAAASRYPDVRTFYVWNELKGFYDERRNRWDHERYTRLYNAVYGAIKRVRPDASVGGPYVVLDSWRRSSFGDPAAAGAWGSFDRRSLAAVRYWLRHKHGADFVALDGSNANNRDGRAAGEFTGCRAFAAAMRWLRGLDPRRYPGADRLPVHWAEWYALPSSRQAGLARRNALMASCLIRTIHAGAARVLIWEPQGDRHGLSEPLGLWTDSRRRGGGQPTPYYRTHAGVARHFAPGTRLRRTHVSGGPLDALASARKLLLVNRSPRALRVAAPGRSLRLGPWAVRFVALER